MRCGRSSPIVCAFMLLALSPGALSRPEEFPIELLRHRWKAQWLRCSDAPRREFGVFHFRKAFTLGSVPDRFVVHASGDNRYELFVNGVRVASGPARGDLDHWRFETLDLAPHLRAGKNALAAVVWNFAELAPMAQMTNETGFILQGDGPSEEVVDTDPTWRCFQDPAVTMIPLDRKEVPFYSVVGPGERVDGAKAPWGWETTDYDDAAWRSAAPISPGGPRAIQDSPSRWMLVPRTIPLMEETPERLKRVVRAQEVRVPDDFLKGLAPVTVPAHTHATVLLDQTHLTTAYPELVASGGRGAELALTYAEALWTGREKGNRNETEGKEMRGYRDVFLPDGGDHRLFRPLWWRTYRYLQLDIETQSEPVVLEDLRGAFTAYPFAARARFEADDPTLGKIWEVGWRTARLCAHETYMDCPYYEQLQYVGDTRIQALISLYVTGDDRLAKNAIEQIDESRLPEGLTESRYPSFLPQVIPPFSLFWIGMMHDFWWYRGERDFLKKYIPGVRGVLGWFESRLRFDLRSRFDYAHRPELVEGPSRAKVEGAPSGLLGRLEWWDFVDWNKEYPSGVPPQEPDGQSSTLSLQFAVALREAADLESDFGSAERAQHDRDLARQIVQAVRRTCWVSSRRLFADTPAQRHFSQHANIFAVLADALPPAEQRALLETVLADPKLTQCSYYFRYYLFRAMKKTGLADDYLKQLEPWRKMLDLGLTTWAETPEPTRSDCHAWSAHPNFDLLATVAGIEPAEPGFRAVALQPHLGPLRHLKASVPLPQGEISAEYRRSGQQLVADVTLPNTLHGWLLWNGQRARLRGGHQHVVLGPGRAAKPR